MTGPGVPTKIIKKSTTNRIRVANSEIIDDSVPQPRTPYREESGQIARAAIDHVDEMIRHKFGSGLPDELKELAADTVRQRVDDWLVASREDNAKVRDNNSGAAPGAAPVARPTFVLAIVTAIVLALAVVTGSLIAMELANRLFDMDRAQTERVTGLEARIADAENLHLELKANALALKANALAQDTAAKTIAADIERRVKQAEARQDALVIYLLEGISKLLVERKISPPDVPPVLQIAKAELMLQAETMLHQAK